MLFIIHFHLNLYLCQMEKLFYGDYLKIGILGGGQLGRMFIQSATSYDVRVHIMENDDQAPAAAGAFHFVKGDILNYDDVMRFGADLDVVTVEIENVNVDALEELEKQGVKVYPQPYILRLIQDKGSQKEFYRTNNIPTADFRLVSNKEETKLNKDFLPFFQKMRRGGYDGKGVWNCQTEQHISDGFDQPCVLEKYIDFAKELSVIVARNESGEIKAFPVVECEFNPKLNLVEFLFSPANIDSSIEKKACEIAVDVIQKLDMVGILAVELFLTKSGEILVNEIAPRPHNSGHHTIECNYTSQFEQHMRAVLDLPLGDTGIVQPGVMVNLIGAEGHSGRAVYEGMAEFLAKRGVYFHLYGKSNTKPNRKMGHVTIADPDLQVAKAVAREVLLRVRVIASQ
jgi:5-(carboxyamino)imidazole ribonucleotide synthase